MKNPPVKVLFRVDKQGVVAVFPQIPGTMLDWDFTVFDAQSGHGPGDFDWYETTRVAKPAEYRNLARSLRKNYGYNLVIGKRFTRFDDEKRHQAAMEF